MATTMIEKTQEQLEQERLLDTLAKIGGQRVQQDELKRQGRELIIPETMTITEVIEYLEDWQSAMEDTTHFSRTFNYRPPDVANALKEGLKEVFGTSGIGKTRWSFFGPSYHENRTVATGIDETTQVPWGELELPMLGGSITVSGFNHNEFGLVGVLSVYAAKKYARHVEGLFVAVERRLREKSIYKGKAIDGQSDPEFLDLRGVDSRKVIYSDTVMENLETNIWAYLRGSDLMREMGVSLKRANLLFGPFGTGKTLAAFLTAQIATENGWTFLYCRPAKDDVMEVMQTARLYQPSVVFVEDVDTIANDGEEGGITRLLDVFDGITAKNTEIQVILTTNHPERIHKAMMRPGRLDSMTEIAALDAGGVKRMIEAFRPEGCVLKSVDYDLVGEATEGYLPAFVSEVIKRAVVRAALREGKKPETLVTDDFVAAAYSLRDQYNRMNEAGEGQKVPGLDKALGAVVAKSVTKIVDDTKVVDHDGDKVFELAAPNGNS